MAVYGFVPHLILQMQDGGIARRRRRWAAWTSRQTFARPPPGCGPCSTRPDLPDEMLVTFYARRK
jgi:hypothetical protein